MKRWLPDDFDPALHNARVQEWRKAEAARSNKTRLTAAAATQVGGEKASGTAAAPNGLRLPLDEAIALNEHFNRYRRADAGLSGRASPDVAHLALAAALGHTNPFVVVPWPPSGNTAVRHANGAHYLQAKVRDYRAVVAQKCIGRGGVHGQYRLNVHMSPPDARRRDADNALKSILDALVPAGFIPDDSLTFMRELWVTVDDKRLGTVAVEAVPLGKEAA